MSYIPIEFKLYAIEKDSSLQTTLTNFIKKIETAQLKNERQPILQFIDNEYSLNGMTLGGEATIKSEDFYYFTKKLKESSLIYIKEYLTFIKVIKFTKATKKETDVIITSITFRDATVIKNIDLPIDYVNILVNPNTPSVKIYNLINPSVLIKDFIEKNGNITKTTNITHRKEYYKKVYEYFEIIPLPTFA